MYLPCFSLSRYFFSLSRYYSEDLYMSAVVQAACLSMQNQQDSLFSKSERAFMRRGADSMLLKITILCGERRML
jgi:hypothetical protein